MPQTFPASPPACPLNAREVLDAYFLETRAKLIEIAATLDRLGRTADANTMRDDPRLGFVQEALVVLQSDQPERAKRIQDLYSK